MQELCKSKEGYRGEEFPTFPELMGHFQPININQSINHSYYQGILTNVFIAIPVATHTQILSQLCRIFSPWLPDKSELGRAVYKLGYLTPA